ncbi:hypothetical protein QZH41_000729, partial [Actinostola sp. cb2023]
KRKYHNWKEHTKISKSGKFEGNNAAVYGRDVSQQNREGEAKSVGESSASHVETDSKAGTMAGKFETVRLDSHHKISSTNTSSKTMDEGIKIIDLDHQSSSQECESRSNSKKIVIDPEQEKAVRKRKKKRYIAKLETRLKYIEDEVKRLSKSELSLEEMELADSNYIQESRLKEQFNKVWEKICKLKGRTPNTGRVVEQEIKLKGTNFPAIDRALQKFLKRKRGFPDIFDIRDIVKKANEKHNFGLSPSVLLEIAADLFTDIGNKIQKKRKKDYEYNFGCHLTDNYLSSLDPALNDNALRKKLDENRKVNENALENVFQKFVHLGRMKGQNYVGGDSTTTSPSDSESSGTEKNARRRSRKKKRDVSDASGEEGRKSKRAKHRPTTVSATITTLESTEVEMNADSICGAHVPSNNKLPVNGTREAISSQCTKSYSQMKDSGKAINGEEHNSIEIIDDDNELTVTDVKPADDKPIHVNGTDENTPSLSNCAESCTNVVEHDKSLTLDGEWDAILTFAQPLEQIEGFDAKKFRYLVLKEKFMEILYFKSGFEGSSSSYSIEYMIKCLEQLEKNCPVKSDYTKLCWLLTVPDLYDQPEYKDWNPETARLECFGEIVQLLRNVIPLERENGSEKVPHSPAQNRLVTLIVKGLCFESCVDYCHQRAVSGELHVERDVISISQDVLCGSLHESTGNFLSWLHSLPRESFVIPFDPMSLKVDLKKSLQNKNFQLSNKRLQNEAGNLSKSLSITTRPSTASKVESNAVPAALAGVKKVSSSYSGFHYTQPNMAFLFIRIQRMLKIQGSTEEIR